ncbi:hypothetical protein OEZ85_012181 [Tetradesmus obliquus]|uniref:Major facilitator superfamily (MFS) profile domain-containing protein n=1 Tax=Tetradesmus obliquus TaxID=3088 RepID=A0ABY8TUW6_TETOB|nr:hypothetical protein OEZ85_012181 [Tetradesmus obliquus]
MLFDDVISKHVGGMGRGQVLVLLASSCSWATLALVVLDMVFTTQKPAWTCSNPADAQCAAVLSSGTGFCSLSPEQYSWTAAYSSLVSSFGLVCSDSWKVGLVNAMFFLGYWVGSCMFGWLSDAYGRKRCLLLSNATSAAAALLCASSRSYSQYVLWRALQGFCSAGLPIASYVLSTEAVGPAFRGRAGTASQMIYHLGEWLLPLLAFWLQDWRLLNLAIAAICCITGLLLLPFPESPRWLLLKGRQQEARQALSWLAAVNGRQLPEGLDITHTVELTAAAEGAEVGGGLREGAADGIADADCCGKGGGDTSSSRSLQQQGAASADVSAKKACRVGLSAAPLAADATSSDIDSDSNLLDSDYTALLSGHDQAAAQAKQAVQGKQHQQHQQQHGQKQPLDAVQPDSGLLALFNHALLARYFVVTALLCTVMAICFYTINLATDSLQGSLYTNFFLTSIGEVPAALLAGAAVDTLGRRITVGTGVLLTGLACCACSLLPPGWKTIALASAGKACCSGTWTISYVYAAEIFPTGIRSVALAGTNQASRLGGVIAPGILYASEQMGLPATAPFAAVGVAALLTAALLSMLPETMGQPQPDSVADLDRLYGKQHSSSSSSSTFGSDGDAQPAGMWGRIKAKYRAAGEGCAGAAGGREGVCCQPSSKDVQQELDGTGAAEAEGAEVSSSNQPAARSCKRPNLITGHGGD